MSKFYIDNGGGGKKDLWILGAICLLIIIALAVILSQFA